MLQYQQLIHSLSPTELVIYNFVKREKKTYQKDVIDFRGLDDSYTRKVLRRLALYGLIKIKRVGKENEIKCRRSK